MSFIDIDNTCSICMETINPQSKRWLKCFNNNIRPKPLICNHIYHNECIDMWLKEHNTCPLCRHIVENDSKNNISDTTISINTELGIFTDRLNKIKKNKKIKKHILFILLYILLLSGAIANILALLSTKNYIYEYNINNINNTNNKIPMEFYHQKKSIIKEIIFISVYVSIMIIFKFWGFLEKHCMPILIPSILITFTICYILYISLTNNNTTYYIKSFQFTDENEKRMNQHIINRNLIILIYNTTVSSLYLLCVNCLFRIL
jgi:hypothetical protein